MIILGLKSPGKIGEGQCLSGENCTRQKQMTRISPKYLVMTGNHFLDLGSVTEAEIWGETGSWCLAGNNLVELHFSHLHRNVNRQPGGRVCSQELVEEGSFLEMYGIRCSWERGGGWTSTPNRVQSSVWCVAVIAFPATQTFLFLSISSWNAHPSQTEG